MLKMKDVLALVKPFDQYDTKDFQDSNSDHFGRDLQIGHYIDCDQRWDDRMCRVAINEWLCTDTMVGVHAHFFDRKFVALSFQAGRKCDCHIYWQSKEDAMRVRDFILSLREDELSLNLIEPDDVLAYDWLLS